MKDRFLYEITRENPKILRGVFLIGEKKTEQKERRRRRHKRRANEQAGKANWKCVRRKKQKQSCNEQQGARRVARLIGYRLPAIDSEPPKGANC